MKSARSLKSCPTIGHYTGAVFTFYLLAAPALAEVSVWQIDTLHSIATFSVRHMMVSTVRGQFGGLKGQASLDDKDITKSTVEATIDSATIGTGEPKRDGDLKGADFFDVGNYPTMKFRSKRLQRAGQRLRLTGDLTIRNVTREVIFDVEGPTPPITNQGVQRRGLTATTRINRRDFGIIWNQVLDNGGISVSNEVSITLDVELKR